MPTDLHKIANFHKIHIVSYDKLPENVSGALDLRDPEKKIILVNAKHSQTRQRFTIAHELGYYFLYHETVHIDKKLFFRNDTSVEGTQKIEREANQFASELLMPKEILLSDLSSISDFEAEEAFQNLAKKYEVSMLALSFRIANLKKGY